ncbi:protein kinase [Archangium violaceum]|uniref:serine/threonine-protein kinase n=1 Tax=Archangium violaceum TaxID=83451 RepID=UPI00193BE1D0|nr:serine/threonine-protein kinase [Archangium violaceum]QRK05264.1 protein kinase [Archangium violaceum]
MKVPPFNPPKEGDRVGEYRVVRVLGEGGFGVVYKVERAGLFFALKLLRARALEKWGQREINILRHLAHPNVVGFHAYDRWPVPLHGYLYFVMDFVEGRTLEDWALDENPSAREMARVLLEVLRALAAVHAQGVFHRDLKRDNILLRDSDARPILVDFGVGWLAGEPTVTRDTLPPGTCEYRSPEAIRYDMEPANKGTHYRPDEGDDLWAMAVTLYWLLTDLLPFGTRRLGGLNDRILHTTPKTPRELNPRVPEALSALCMRMLAKERSGRFADCAGLCRALEAALASAEPDGPWDLPLLDPDAPDRAPTAQDPDKAPRDVEALEVLQWNVLRPRRGRKAGQKPAPEGEKQRTPVVDAPAPLPAAELPARGHVAAEPAPSPEALAALLADVPAAPRNGALPPPVADGARPAPGPAPLPPSPLRQGSSRVVPTRVGLLAMKPVAQVVVFLAVVALASAAAFVVRPRTAPVTLPAPVSTATPRAAAYLPEGWRPECPTPRACPGTELAVSPETAEAEGGAAPLVATTPALATAMPLRKQESRLPPQELPAPAPQSQGGRCKKWQCLAASCGWVLVACSGPQVRATPGPEDCPAGALATMKEELSLGLSDSVAADIPPGTAGERVTVRAGDAAVTLPFQYGNLDEGTVLTGRFFLGKERLYGRFTRAQTPQGKVYPVCMEIAAPGGAGEPIKADAGSDAVKVHARVSVYVVSRFH